MLTLLRLSHLNLHRLPPLLRRLLKLLIYYWNVKDLSRWALDPDICGLQIFCFVIKKDFFGLGIHNRDFLVVLVFFRWWQTNGAADRYLKVVKIDFWVILVFEYDVNELLRRTIINLKVVREESVIILVLTKYLNSLWPSIQLQQNMPSQRFRNNLIFQDVASSAKILCNLFRFLVEFACWYDFDGFLIFLVLFCNRGRNTQYYRSHLV